LLAVVYYLMGQFTLTLSLPPSGAMPLWAPAGVALAAVMIWGYSLLPGIFVGSFLVTASLAGIDNTASLSLSILSGVQAMIHAAFGYWLLVKNRVWPDDFILDSKIIKFLLLAGIVSSLLPAIFTVAVHLSFNLLSMDSWLVALIVWWVGGAIGIVIFTPIVLILFALPKKNWRSRIYTVALPMLVLFIILVVVFQSVKDSETKRIAERFYGNARLVHTLVENELELHRTMLRSTRAYFQNSEGISEHEFEAYSNDFSLHQNDILSAIWVEYVSNNERDSYEQLVGYPIVELEGRELVPASYRQEYYVIKYKNNYKEKGDSADVGDKFLGFDLCSDNEQKIFCGKTHEQAQIIVIDPVETSGDLKILRELIIALPVKDANGGIKGLVLHEIDYQSSLTALLSNSPQKWVDLTIVDKELGSLLFSSADEKYRNNVLAGKIPRLEREVKIGDKQRLLYYSPTEYFLQTYASWSFYWLIIGALTVLSLIGAWLLMITGRVQLVNKEVDNKTQEITLNAKLLADSENKYRRLVENINEEYLLYSHDNEGILNYISPSIEHLLGYSSKEFLTHYSTYMPDTEINRRVEAYTQKTLAGEHNLSYEIEIISKQGELHTFELIENPAYDDRGIIIGAEGIAHDVTQTKKTRLELEKLSLAVQQSPNAVVITHRDGTIEYVNPKFTEITGYSADEAIGKWPDIVDSGENSEAIYRDLWKTVLSGKQWRGELKNRKKNGDLYWAKEFIAPMFDTEGTVTHFVIAEEDVTEARRLTEQTSYQASHDLLTGLINRSEFEFRLERLISAAKNDLVEHVLCFIDLDHFKIVNDSCGHVAGDELLRQIGSLLQANIRSRDTLARLGGDEFAVLMEHTDIEQAYQTCGLIIELIKAFRFSWQDQNFTMGASIGLAIIDGQLQDSTEAMKHVDAACHEAKDAGRNRVQIYTADNVRLQKRKGEIQWSSEISHALDNDLFLLYVQPIVPLLDDTLKIGYEVLLRMKASDGQIVSPGTFLPAAERYNSATRIDRWVVSHTLHWVQRHANELNHVSTIAINLSGHSIGDDAMLSYIMSEFEKGKVPAEKIKFEITETAAIANLRAATIFIKTLKKYGCHFALDDFGSGLSSFAYLKHFDVDSLKIDGMFVKDMLDDPIDFEMVKSINQIGHVMGLETIAEFVENDQILEKLREIGIDYVQGYRLGKPMPIDSILE